MLNMFVLREGYEESDSDFLYDPSQIWTKFSHILWQKLIICEVCNLTNPILCPVSVSAEAQKCVQWDDKWTGVMWPGASQLLISQSSGGAWQG